jgi:sec-independent protein translocase protein TatC
MPAARGQTVRKIKGKEATLEDIEAIERGDSKLSLSGHLGELRSRFMTVLIATCIATAGPFFIGGDKLVKLMTWPFYKAGLKNQTLNVFNFTEGFMLQIKSALIIGLLVIFPFIVYQIWAYIKPAVSKKRRGFYRWIIFFSILLFYTGAALTFFFLVPLAIRVLAAFTPDNMTTIFSATNYLHFVLFFCAAMGFIAEMPMIILVLTRVGIITPAFLVKKRKYAIVIIWITAAIITPTTDALSLTLVAVPLMLLYEISIMLSKIMVFRARKRERDNR